MRKSVCFVFTKQFPFENKEAYLIDEAPYLNQYFDFVYYVPYAEYGFQPNRLRIQIQETNRVLNVNTGLSPLSWIQKTKALLPMLWVLAEDWITSRERGKTMSRMVQNFKRLTHYYASSRVLKESMDQHQGDDLYFYHYWLHDGLIIQKLAQGVWKENAGFTIARAHSLDLYHKNWPLPSYLPYERVKLSMVDEVSSISQHGFRFLNQTFPRFKNKISYHPLGVQDLGFVDEERHPSALIVTVSWMIPLKRLDRVMAMMCGLPRYFKWVHIGNGDEAILAQLVEDSKRHGISFESLGYLSKPAVHRFFEDHAVAFFCNMSVWEGVPVSLMEAAMWGVPMIVSDIPGNREVVDERNGWVVSGEDWNASICSAIADVYEHPEKWRAMSRAARNTFDLKYNAQKNYSDFFGKMKKRRR